MLNEQLPNTIGEALKDGVVLCKYVHTLSSHLCELSTSIYVIQFSFDTPLCSIVCALTLSSRLVNKIQPGLIPNINPNPGILAHLENISAYLQVFRIIPPIKCFCNAYSIGHCHTLAHYSIFLQQPLTFICRHAGHWVCLLMQCLYHKTCISRGTYLL